jgi:hypothetical protein
MSTFRRRIGITLDGERYEVTTSASDQLKAEQAIGREKLEVLASPLTLQARVAFNAFTRTYPDNPMARNWAKFLELFDDIDDLDAEEADALDPTLAGDMES